jgi:hypothetical protein
MKLADGLIEFAERTGNPLLLASALGAYGWALHETDPVAALHAEQGATESAFDHLTVAIRNYQNSGNTTTICILLAILAVLLDRLGRCEPAATIAGFRGRRVHRDGDHRNHHHHHPPREVLGDLTYESDACKGEVMTTAIATYAYNEIDQARTKLSAG